MPACIRSASRAAAMPRQPSSQPPLGTESRWLPTITVFVDLPAASPSCCRPNRCRRAVRGRQSCFSAIRGHRATPAPTPGAARRRPSTSGGNLAQVRDNALSVMRGIVCRDHEVTKHTKTPRRKQLCTTWSSSCVLPCFVSSWSGQECRSGRRPATFASSKSGSHSERPSR